MVVRFGRLVRLPVGCLSRRHVYVIKARRRPVSLSLSCELRIINALCPRDSYTFGVRWRRPSRPSIALHDMASFDSTWLAIICRSYAGRRHRTGGIVRVGYEMPVVTRLTTSFSFLLRLCSSFFHPPSIPSDLHPFDDPCRICCLSGRPK